jgi:hypothetical protein
MKNSIKQGVQLDRTLDIRLRVKGSLSKSMVAPDHLRENDKTIVDRPPEY